MLIRNFYLIIIFLFIFACSNTPAEKYKTPEQLSRIVFNDIKNIKTFDDLTDLLKYSPSKSDIMNIYGKSTLGDVNIESSIYNYNFDLIKWITGNIWGLYPELSQVLFTNDTASFTVEDYCEMMVHKSRDFIEINGDFVNKRNFLNTHRQYLDLLLNKFNIYMSNAEYSSLSRGSSSYDEDIKGTILWSNNIHFIIENEEKKFFIESFSEYGKGWKILVFDD